MNKQDITMHSDDELSLLVMNDEALYNQRHSRLFIRLLQDLFIYNDDQYKVLKQDLADDLAENEG